MPPREVQMLEPQELLQAIAAKTREPMRRRDERVSYYRRPSKLPNGRSISMPLWIIYGDTQPGKRDDYIYRGFYPLFKYGRIWDGNDRDGELYKLHGVWGPILSKRGGPEEFPLEQVITYRWYRKENIGSPDQGYEPMTHVRFPQLSQAIKDGLKIQEYLCPDCSSISFLQPVLLGRHLRNSHSWDRQDITTWGDAIGIDFRAEFRPKVVSDVFVEDVEVEPEPEEEDFDDLPLGVEQVLVPSQDQVRATAVAEQKQCGPCRASKAGRCVKHRDPEADDE